MRKVTDQITSDVTDLSNLGNGLDIAGRASDCACCGASASISAYVLSHQPSYNRLFNHIPQSNFNTGPTKSVPTQNQP
jgi:hypothetical protein